MSRTRHRCRLALEVLEKRLAMSSARDLHILPTPTVPLPPGDTLTLLNDFAQVYGTKLNQPTYNPAFDLNHNGRIGQVDGRLLLKELPPLGPKVPIRLYVAIAPQDNAHPPVPTNLGGVTHLIDPLVVGHTTPGALVFTGTGTTDLKLAGPVVVANAQGNFSLHVQMSDGINQFDLLAVDHYGHQTLRAFPILWLGFARYQAEHPKKT